MITTCVLILKIYNIFMLNFTFIKTEDESIGLFNPEVNDIYHSKFGAKEESYEKFILPSGILNHAKENNSVKILDICFGVGYNTKTSLYHLVKVNPNINIKVDAIESDKNTILFSPFIKDSINDEELNLYLLMNIIESGIFDLDYVYEVLNFAVNEYKEVLNGLGILYLKNYQIDGCNSSSKVNKMTFLHNIYYQYVSNSIKIGQKLNKYQKCAIKWLVNDSRIGINDTTSHYDFIFLDAFTPEKDPTLWTVDFLNLIKNRMHKNSVLVTYSISAAFRAELLELGFYVGKILKEENQIGTIASFNKNKIFDQLSEHDLNLLKTNAGIFYRDSKLNSSNDEILNNRKNELKNSDRISTTKFLKSCR